MKQMHRELVRILASMAALAGFLLPSLPAVRAAGVDPADAFRTSDRCLVCHNNLKTINGGDASIGSDWAGTIMANAARDPYWQGSVRREAIEHPESSAAIQNECASCHMPVQYLRDKSQAHDTEVFKRLPLRTDHPEDAAAADGVSCAVCHQIQSAGLGSPATYNGNFAIAPLDAQSRPVFGPFAPVSDSISQLHVAAAGYTLAQSAHIRDAGLCGSCHTLYTVARGPGGKPIGRLPEQMPYLEWLHSDYPGKQTCQQCHMPAVEEQAPIASVASQPREGLRRHTFTGANFLMVSMLETHQADLGVSAASPVLQAAERQIEVLLKSQAARITVTPSQPSAGELSFAVRVENLTGHKLPTAFPSRRAWLHVVVTAPDGHTVFESGKLNKDGSIQGNANDADPARFSPHYTRITRSDQVEIFEPILGDTQDRVTTGLLSATHYLKDNRILPAGFDKKTASSDIAVRGRAASDPDFSAGSSTTHYQIATRGASGPFQVTAELMYQPIGYRWAHNLAPYPAAETQRFVQYYDQAAARSAAVLARAQSSIAAGP